MTDPKDKPSHAVAWGFYATIGALFAMTLWTAGGWLLWLLVLWAIRS